MTDTPPTLAAELASIAERVRQIDTGDDAIDQLAQLELLLGDDAAIVGGRRDTSTVARWAAADKLLEGGTSQVRYGTPRAMYPTGQDIDVLMRLSDEVPAELPKGPARARIVRQGGKELRAIAFGMGDRFDELMSEGGQCCLAFTPRINEWQGYRSVELEVRDFQAGPRARLA